MSICQLQNLMKRTLVAGIFGILLQSCATTAPVDTKIDERVIKASWLKLPLRFAHQDKDDQPITHPFFDIDPTLATQNNQFTLRYFLATAAESSFQYDLDLLSGRLYRTREYCPQDDIWEFYTGQIEKPNFAQGFVPRIFDENKKPQRIMILSDKEHIQPFKHHPTHYDDARIVGSFIVEACESFPCDRADKWTSSQILVGVSPYDSRMAGVETFTELKSKVDWSYTKAMLVNMHGTFSVGGKHYPAYRISRELNTRDTKKYFDEKATIVNVQKLSDWRVGCMKMYDSLWEESEKIRALKYNQADEFLKFFKAFYAKDSGEFYKCQQLVRPGNINEDYRRVWFFSFIQAFNLLEKNGFFYNCHDNAWAYNPKVDGEKYFNNQNKELARCRSKDFEKSFDQAINGMSLMKNQTNLMFRFIEFDNLRGGSHQKIYGWVPEKTTHHACKGKAKTSAQPSELFPQDVIWEHFQNDVDKTIR